MTYRIFRYSGAVLDRVDTYTDPTTLPPDDNAIAEVAAALGVDAKSITAEHVEAVPPIAKIIPPAPTPAPAPDPNGFLLAAMSALGLVPGNTLLSKWPTFTVAINASNWGVTRMVLGAALQAGDLTQEQYGTLTGLLTDFGIPEA